MEGVTALMDIYKFEDEVRSARYEFININRIVPTEITVNMITYKSFVQAVWHKLGYDPVGKTYFGMKFAFDYNLADGEFKLK